MKNRIINLLFALDCFLFNVVTLGGSYPFESFSAAAWRAELEGKWYRHARPIIDAIMWFQPHHCQRAYEHAKYNLPPDELQAN